MSDDTKDSHRRLADALGRKSSGTVTEGRLRNLVDHAKKQRDKLDDAIDNAEMSITHKRDAGK